MHQNLLLSFSSYNTVITYDFKLLKKFCTLSLYVAQAALELTVDSNNGFLIPQVPPPFWDCKHMPHPWVCFKIL